MSDEATDIVLFAVALSGKLTADEQAKYVADLRTDLLRKEAEAASSRAVVVGHFDGAGLTISETSQGDAFYEHALSDDRGRLALTLNEKWDKAILAAHESWGEEEGAADVLLNAEQLRGHALAALALAAKLEARQET